MHNIGKLYITVSTPRAADGGAEGEAWEALLREWHPRIAGSILKHWKFPLPIVAAVVEQNNDNSSMGGDGGLTDVLMASIELGSRVFRNEPIDDAATAGPCFQRLRLGSGDCKQMLAAAALQIKALRAALTG